MYTHFNKLVDSFLENNVGIADQFLSESLANKLKDNLTALYKKNMFLPAGTGNDKQINHDRLVRSDVIYWLDRRHKDAVENEFFDLIDDFVSYLNRTCYTGITGYEFHYTMYDQGSFYKKHLDQFRNNDSRKYSMIMYLNSNWKKEDGGELCIHHEDHLQNIEPTNRKSVFFRSNEIEHEVLLSNKPRLGLAGWFKVN